MCVDVVFLDSDGDVQPRSAKRYRLIFERSGERREENEPAIIKTPRKYPVRL